MPPSARIVSVLLPQPLPEPFDYELPEGMTAPPGSFVVVPLGPREMIGVAGLGRRRIFVLQHRRTDRRRSHLAAHVHPRAPLLAHRQFVDSREIEGVDKSEI
jgi:hypothetical protein